MATRTCAYGPCKRLFTGRPDKKYCCSDHQQKAHQGRRRPPYAQRTCAWTKCEVTFTPRRKDQIFHSGGCRKAYWFEQKFVERAAGRPPMRLIDCTICGTPKTPFGGITTMLGYFCYACVKWIHQVADETVQLKKNPAAKLETD